jgi:predicted phosphodiesterase
MRVHFFGDVHQEYRLLSQMLEGVEAGPIIQVGDVGLGCPGAPDPEPGPLDFPSRFRFIRGNHDDPAVCRKHPSYLGDFGVHSETGVFFLSGGRTLDTHSRIVGWDLFPDEELSRRQFDEAISLYERVRPKIVVTHECPASACDRLFHLRDKPSLTSLALDAMFEIHQPKMWVFGHHHVSLVKKYRETLFCCVGPNDFITALV